MSDDPFAPIAGVGRKPAKASPEWSLVVPVTADAPPTPAQHPKLGEHLAAWRYTDAAGRLLGYVRRFDNVEVP
jgi:putative DNA primase/helicase